MRICLVAVMTMIVLGLTACGGGRSLSGLDSQSADELTPIRAFSSSGALLGAGAVTIESANSGKGRRVVVRANDPTVMGIELAYDPTRESVAEAAPGETFRDSGIFLAVTGIPGLVAVGGYAGHPCAEGAVLATITFKPGSSPSAKAASALPIGSNCIPQEFAFQANGTIAQFSWIYSCAGDYDQNGEVNISDITPIGLNYGAQASGASLLDYNVADGDLNGEVNISDLTPIGAFYFTAVSGYVIERGNAQSGPFSEAKSVPLGNGNMDGRLRFNEDVTDALDGEWYRARAYHNDDPSQGAACDPIQISIGQAGSRPTAVAGADVTSGEPPLTVNFNAAGSSDSDGTIVSYEWDLDGNGSYETDATSTSGSTQHTFDNIGNYTVRLKVTDNDNLAAVDSIAINVSSLVQVPPVAYAYALPAQGWAPLTVDVSGFMSNDPDGTIVSWEWDFDNNGSFETAGTGDWGYASHTYSAGSHTATLRLTDNGGNTSTASVAIDVRDPAVSSVDYWNVFDRSKVKKVEFSVSQANWDLMWADINAEVEVEADLNMFPGTPLAATLPSVGLRMKGNSSLNNPTDKKPWKVDTNQYDPAQEFANMKMLIFNNGFKDPSLTREMLAYEMMQTAGVQAGNTCFVEIWISVAGAPLEFWGVYTMVERVDKKFLENRYGDDTGNLYKCQNGSDLKYYGTNIATYPIYQGGPCYQKETNGAAADYSDVINLCKVIDGTTYGSPAQFKAALDGVMNVDSFLRYLAVTLSHSNLDIFMYMDQNFYLYGNPLTGKFEWIPWDLNEAWGLFGNQTSNENCPLYTMGGTGGPGAPQSKLFTQVMAVPEYRQAYAAYVDLLRRDYFTEANISTKAQGLHDLAASYVTQGDKMYYGAKSMYPVTAFHNNWNTDIAAPPPAFFAFGVTSFTATRDAYIDSHLMADF